MKQFLMLAVLTLLTSHVFAQTDIDLFVGASKADYSISTLRVSWPVTDRLRLGASFEGADYRHRFIDTRPVSNGFAGTFRLVMLARLAESGNIRLDGFLKPGFRIIQAPDDDPQEFTEYQFADSRALTLDPGLLVTLKAGDRLRFHTGANLHMSYQLAPLTLLEQYPSIRILGGASYQLGDHVALFATGDTGPMSGAGGDTEKYFWRAAIGLRYRIGSPSDDLTVLGF